jgi:type III secretory pathway component EscT
MRLEPGFLQIVAEALESTGVDLRGWALSWARMSPSIALVPAFGLRAIPAPARTALGLALAASVAPALAPLAGDARPWPIALLIETSKGLPIALSASIALWTATMTGGLIDNLRGSRDSAALPVIENGSTPSGVLFGLLVAIAFLEMGGPGRVAALVSRSELEFTGPLLRAAGHLTQGVELAVLVAAPLIAVSVVWEVASSLVTRAASPASVQQLIAPLRSLTLLAVLAVLFERILGVLVTYAKRFP